MTDVPPDPLPLPDREVPTPPPTEVPGEGGFNDGEVEIEEPLGDEIPPL